MHIEHKIVSLLVVVLLVLTQAFGVIHKFDSSAHEYDQGCELCVHLSNLDDGLSTDSSINPPTFLVLITEAGIPEPLFTPFLSTYLSRAPPVYCS